MENGHSSKFWSNNLVTLQNHKKSASHKKEYETHFDIPVATVFMPQGQWGHRI